MGTLQAVRMYQKNSELAADSQTVRKFVLQQGPANSIDLLHAPGNYQEIGYLLGFSVNLLLRGVFLWEGKWPDPIFQRRLFAPRRFV